MNQESKLVSIIIPCYNQAHFLPDSIGSILAQTYQNFEIIVIDDGSKDNTSEVALSYPKVRSIRQKNQGLAASRNNGIKESKGEYLVFLDADDRLLPNALEIGVKSLEEHPECGFVFGSHSYIDKDGTPILSMPKPTIVESGYYIELLKRNYIALPASVMYQRFALDKVGGFNAAISPSADYELYLRIASRFPIYGHNQIVGEYRQHGESMSRNLGRMLKFTLLALSSQKRNVKGNREHEEAYKEGVRLWQDYYGDRIADTIRAQVRKPDQWTDAARNMFALLRYSPRVFSRHFLRKLYCVLFRVKSDFAS
jgi:glycosyltransferase involved in cell wall biosynthesis